MISASAPAMKLYWATVADVIHEYDDTYSYVLAPQEPVPFSAGQFVHLVAPGAPLEREMIRHMSIASTPSDGIMVFSMNLASGSPYKRKFAAVKRGDEVPFFKIKGEFTLDRLVPGASAVFIAGGIGITPIRALIRRIEQEQLPVDWSLVHVGHAFLYQKELSAYPSPQLRIGRPEVPGTLDRVAAYEGATFFVSGSRDFIVDISSSLVERGVDPDHIALENFDH